jgi:DNA (cytosine-5)-methyltransferase 1
MNYYNEFDPFAAAWLRELIKANLIPNGIVDERSIIDVKPEELREFKQCHFFAGIGGWSYALQLAGWPTDRPVWTGSCPCQPFSSAGKQKGKADERHLWPVWFNLIRECRPPVIFGEQVSSAIAHWWLDDVYQGLESEGYACGSAIIPACSVGAPHKRDRLWFVADTQCEQTHEEQFRPSEDEGEWAPNVSSRCGLDNEQSNVGNSEHARPHGRPLSGSNGEAIPYDTQGENSSCKSSGTSEPCDVADSKGIYAQGCENGQGEREPWGSGTWIDCPDGKQRRVEPGIRLLAHGVPNRVGKLRGYGNAIVPAVGAAFIQAFLEVENV